MSLARLGVDSGGKLAERSNDAGQAFDAAARSAACTYALGITDDRPREDRPRSFEVWMRERGQRARHATNYALRSISDKRESLLRAAYLAPALFDTGGVHAALVPLRPAGAGGWQSLLAMSFPLPLAAAGEASPAAEFGLVLSRGSDVVRRMQRRIRLEPLGTEASSVPRVTFVETLDVGPGSYALSAVVAASDDPVPRSVQVEVEVPAVPNGGWFFVGPILGRRAGADLVVRGEAVGPRGRSAGAGTASDALGSEDSFQPLLVPRVEFITDIVALTEICAAGQADAASAIVDRALRRISGEVVGRLEPQEMALDPSDPVRCRTVVDHLPGGAFAQGGEYVFEATLTAAGEVGISRAARLAVGAPPPAEPAANAVAGRGDP